MARKQQVLFTTSETGCITPTTHKLNKDGYFRCTHPEHTGTGRGIKIMYHRYVWIKENGSIPEGYEIDHMCKNRACCNIEHLQMLDRTTHLVKTNKERYAPRKEAARLYWFEHKCTGTKLAELFKVSFSIGCKWIREWKV